MLIKTSQWLQEPASDTPTKGLLWSVAQRLLDEGKPETKNPHPKLGALNPQP